MKIKNIFVFGVVILLLVNMQFSILSQEEIIDWCAMEGNNCGEGYTLETTYGFLSHEGKILFPENGGELIIGNEENEIIITGGEGIEFEPFVNKIRITESDVSLTINGEVFEGLNSNSKFYLDLTTGEISQATIYPSEGKPITLGGMELEGKYPTSFDYDSNWNEITFA